MRLIAHSLFLCLVTCCLIGFTGCQDSGKKKTPTTTSTTDDHRDDHDDDKDEHEHAETYDEAVTELAELEKVIRDGYENDKAGDAHDALHDVPHVLEEIEGFIKKSDMDDATKKAATQAATDLFDSFTAVDDKEHGVEGGKDFKDVSDTIAAAMKTLLAHVGKADDAKAEESKE